MFKKLCLSVIAISLVACTQNQYRAKVGEKYPDAEIQVDPHHTHDFIIRKPDGSVWRLEGKFWSPGIRSEAMLFGPLRQTSLEKN